MLLSFLATYPTLTCELSYKVSSRLANSERLRPAAQGWTSNLRFSSPYRPREKCLLWRTPHNYIVIIGIPGQPQARRDACSLTVCAMCYSKVRKWGSVLGSLFYPKPVTCDPRDPTTLHSVLSCSPSARLKSADLCEYIQPLP